MPRTSDGSGSGGSVESLMHSVEKFRSVSPETLLQRREVRETDSQGTEFLVPTQEMMEELLRAYQTAAALARSGAEVTFYAQTVALLRRFDRRLSALEDRANMNPG